MVAVVTLVGSGTIGPLLELSPWSVTEDATPVAPGDTSGGTGTVSINARYGVDSEFVIDNELTLTEARLGEISGGKVSTVNPVSGPGGQDLSVGLSSGTGLDELVVRRAYGPFIGSLSDYFNALVGLGAPPSWMDEWSPTYSSSLEWGATTDSATGDVYYFKTLTAGGILYVQRVTSDGGTVNVIGAGANGSGDGQFGAGYLPSVYYSPFNDHVYVFDTGNRRVQYFTPSGTFVGKWGTAGTGDGQFQNVTGINQITGDSLGNIYVSDHNGSVVRTQKFSATGTFITSWTGSGMLLAVDSSDTIWAVDSVTGVDHLFNFSNTGTLIDTYDTNATGGALQASFGGIAIDSEDRIYISGMNPPPPYVTPYAGVIRRFGNDGAFIDSWGQVGTAEGQYQDGGSGGIAFGIAIDQDSNVLYAHDNVARKMNLYLISEHNTFRSPVEYQGSTDPAVIVQGWVGDVWDHVKQVCAAFGVELAPVAGSIVVRDVGSRVLSLDNASESGTPKISLNSQSTGLSVDFVNYNTTGGSGTVYDAWDEDNVLTVGVGERKTVTIQTNNYPAVITQPYNNFYGSLP